MFRRRLGFLCVLAVLFLGLAAPSAMAENKTTSVGGFYISAPTSAVNESAFPYLSTSASQRNTIINAFIFQTSLFKGTSGAGSNLLGVLRYLSVFAAVVGALLIVFFPKYQKLPTIASWLLVTTIVVFAPYGSQLLFYPADGYANESKCSETTKVCGFTPQLVAMHVAATFQRILSDLFMSEGWSGLLEGAKAQAYIRQNGALVLPDSWFKESQKFEEMCGEKISPRVLDLKNSQSAMGEITAPMTMGEAWKKTLDFYRGKDIRIPPPVYVFYTKLPDKYKNYKSGYESGLTALYNAYYVGDPKIVSSNPQAGSGSITPEVALQKIRSKGFFSAGNSDAQILPGFFFTTDTDTEQDKDALARMRLCYPDPVTFCPGPVKGSINPQSPDPWLHQKLMLEIADNRESFMSKRWQLFSYWDSLGKWNQFLKVVPEMASIPMGVMTPTVDGINKTVKFSPIQQGYDCQFMGQELIKQALDNTLFAERAVFGDATETARFEPLKGLKEILTGQTPSGAGVAEVWSKLIITPAMVNPRATPAMIKETETGKAMAPDVEIAKDVARYLTDELQKAQMSRGNEAPLSEEEKRYILWSAYVKAAMDNTATYLRQQEADDPTNPKGTEVAFYGNQLLTQGIGNLGALFGKAIAKVGAFIEGAKATAFLMFLTMLVDMALMAIIVLTPIFFVVGVLMPGTAMGVLTISVLGVFILKFVPITVIILNGIGNLMRVMIAASGATDVNTMQDLLILAISGMYLNVVGLTFFLLFKMGNPEAILGRLQGLDSAAKELADKGVGAAIAAAGVAAGATGAAIAGGGAAAYLKKRALGAAGEFGHGYAMSEEQRKKDEAAKIAKEQEDNSIRAEALSKKTSDGTTPLIPPEKIDEFLSSGNARAPLQYEGEDGFNYEMSYEDGVFSNKRIFDEAPAWKDPEIDVVGEKQARLTEGTQAAHNVGKTLPIPAAQENEFNDLIDGKIDHMNFTDAQGNVNRLEMDSDTGLPYIAHKEEKKEKKPSPQEPNLTGMDEDLIAENLKKNPNHIVKDANGNFFRGELKDGKAVLTPLSAEDAAQMAVEPDFTGMNPGDVAAQISMNPKQIVTDANGNKFRGELGEDGYALMKDGKPVLKPIPAAELRAASATVAKAGATTLTGAAQQQVMQGGTVTVQGGATAMEGTKSAVSEAPAEKTSADKSAEPASEPAPAKKTTVGEDLARRLDEDRRVEIMDMKRALNMSEKYKGKDAAVERNYRDVQSMIDRIEKGETISEADWKDLKQKEANLMRSMRGLKDKEALESTDLRGLNLRRDQTIKNMGEQLNAWVADAREKLEKAVNSQDREFWASAVEKLEKIDPIALAAGEKQKEQELMDYKRVRDQWEKHSARATAPGFLKGAVSGLYGSITGSFQGAGSIPVLGKMVKESVNEWVQAPERARAWNTAGGFGKWFGANTDAQRMGFYQKEMGPLGSGEMYNQMMQQGAFQAQVDLARQAAVEAVARQKSSFDALQWKLNDIAKTEKKETGTSSDRRGHMLAKDLEGLGRMEALNKVNAVYADSVEMTHGQFNIQLPEFKNGVFTGVKESKVNKSLEVLADISGGLAAKAQASNMDDMLVRHYGIFEKRFFRKDKSGWSEAENVTGSRKAIAEFSRMDVDADHLVGGHLKMAEGKALFFGMRGRYIAMNQLRNQEKAHVEEQVYKIMEDNGVAKSEIRQTYNTIKNDASRQTEWKNYMKQANKRLGQENLVMTRLFAEAENTGLKSVQLKSEIARFSLLAAEQENMEKIQKAAGAAIDANVKHLNKMATNKLTIENKATGFRLDLGKATEKMYKNVYDVLGTRAGEAYELLTKELEKGTVEEQQKAFQVSKYRDNKNKGVVGRMAMSRNVFDRWLSSVAHSMGAEAREQIMDAMRDRMTGTDVEIAYAFASDEKDKDIIR